MSTLASVKITFPEAKFLGMYGSNLNGVTLTSVSDPTVVYEPCNTTYSTFFASNSQTFSLRRKGQTTAAVVEEPGDYVLHFPKECFELCGDWYKHLGYSEEINVTYTIGGTDPGFENYFDTSAIIVRPVPGSLMEFRDVSLSFPVTSSNPTIDIADTGGITLTRDDGRREYVITESKFDGEGGITFNFRRKSAAYPHAEYMYEPGKYTIKIPAGIFRLTATDIVNEAMTLEYTVTGTNSASQKLTRYELTPAPSYVDKIETIVIEYPDLDEPLSFPDGITDVTDYLAGRITLRRLNTDPDLCSVYIPHSARLLSDNRIEFTFRNRVLSGPEPSAETLTRPGDYQLTVLPNTFKLKSNTFAFNARIEAYYTIGRDVPANPMTDYELYPADGQDVGRISEGSITFRSVADGLDYPIDKTAITLTNVDDPNDVYEARKLMLRGNTLSWGWNRPDHKYDDGLTITREGTYRLHIDAGAMKDYSNTANVNPEITALYHVSPDNLFNYELTPAPGNAYTSLPSITVSAADGATNLRPTLAAGDPATLREANGTSYVLSCGADCSLALPADLPTGNYTLNIPAGYFVETNLRGQEVTSPVITASYRLVRPMEFEASLLPASGSTVSGLSVISVTPTGASLRSFGVDETAGEAKLTGPDGTIVLRPSVSQYSVAFMLPDGVVPGEGEYTFTLPAGYVTIVDGNGIATSLGTVTARYTIAKSELPDLSGGIFFLNEGAFGRDYGSLNYLEPDYATIHYDLFGMANNGAGLGVTAQYGDIFGGSLYVISKQSSYSSAGGLLTVADAATMEAKARVSVADGDGRAICCVNSAKAYVGTSSGIYRYNYPDSNLGERIVETESAGSRYDNQTGEMVRLGHRVFAALQGKGIAVIDTDTDKLLATISLSGVIAPFVTATGHLYAATSDASAPFVEIDPATFVTTAVAAEGMPTLSNIWSSWHKAPLAAAIDGDVIFYAPADNSSYLTALDLSTGEYKERFIRLPEINGSQARIYGGGVSVDPATGYVVVTALSSLSYQNNVVYFADPTSGRVMTNLTLPLRSNYWFPAMAIYPVGAAPVISELPDITMEPGDNMELDLASETYLSSGNPYLTVYDCLSDNESVCRAGRLENGLFSLTATGEGRATLRLIADNRGAMGETTVEVAVGSGAGIAGINGDNDESFDVYGIDGTVVRRNARRADLKTLRPGIYIVNSQKIIILN